MGRSEYDPRASDHKAWNAGKLVGAKRAPKPQQVWAIRFLLDREKRVRDRALFDVAVDSKLRGCDVVKIKIGELVSGGHVRSRAIVMQQKTGWPVQFEILEPARTTILAWLERRVSQHVTVEGRDVRGTDATKIEEERSSTRRLRVAQIGHATRLT